jgi:GNAT superfamily N-acetyltransferase
METDEVLETGYGPATPAGDNICNDFAQGLATGYTELAAARGDRVFEDPQLAIALTDSESPSLFTNSAIARRPLTDDEWAAAAASMHRFYAERPGGPWLLFSAWPTPDLRAHDFGLVGHPPLMLRLPGPVSPRAIEGFELRPVTDATTARDWEWVFVHAFPDTALQQAFSEGCFLPEQALAAEGWKHWVGYLDGQPVGTASAHAGTNNVHVEFISTVEHARGRGIGGALVVAALSAGPHLPALLIASDLGRPVYSRLGFMPLLRFTLWAGHREP